MTIPGLRDLPLFEHALARARDPSTSKQAARSVAATDIEAVVLSAIAQHGPMTTHEIAAKTGLSLVTVSPRMKPLTLKGKVEDSSIRRRGESGRMSIVWRLL